MLKIVQDFYSNKSAIQQSCCELSGFQLLSINKKRTYGGETFDREQTEHRVLVRERFVVSRSKIQTSLHNMLALFGDRSVDVTREWRTYVESVDKAVCASLHVCVKKSLQELLQSVVRRDTIDMPTLFGVSLSLEGGKIDFKPTVTNLTHSLNTIIKVRTHSFCFHLVIFRFHFFIRFWFL